MFKPRTILGVFIVVIGLSMLFDFPFLQVFIALVVIWFGFTLITGRGSTFTFNEQTESSEDEVKRVLIFSGINKKFNSNEFKGAEVVAVFGGGEIDLSGVKTKEKELTLEFVTVFGGLKVILPKSWSVSSEGIGIVGGFDNKSKVSGQASTKVTVEGAAIFGGVELVN